MSLGWLTESSLIPKKAKPIEVNSKSFLGLQAALFQRAHQKKGKVSTSSKKLSDILNPQQIPEEEPEIQPESDINRSTLDERCQLYYKLRENQGLDKQSGKYLVDFLHKEDSSSEEEQVCDVLSIRKPVVKQSYDRILSFKEKE